MENSQEQINALVLKYGLSKTVRQAIIEISKESYTEGVKSACNAIIKYGTN